VARLGDLSRIGDIEESAVDDGIDAERDAVQLDPKTTVSRRDRSSDRDAAGIKPRGESCRIGQALEQLRDDRPFRDEAPVIGRDPRQQVSGADDQTVAVIDSDCPGLPKGITHPVDSGDSIGEAEAFAERVYRVN
jgi:hypothetical protein